MPGHWPLSRRHNDENTGSDGRSWKPSRLSPDAGTESNPKFPAEFDKETYKWRHLIENYFGKLKENRGIAMRSCKTDQSFKAIIAIAATLVQSR